jgi:hypothetical protein
MNCSYCGSAMPADARYCGECGRGFALTAAIDLPGDPVTTAVLEVQEASGTPIPAEVPDFAPPDLDKTIIVGAANAGSFMLQFSTGESVTVAGTGLIGRHPVPEPGEYFDQLVTISDASKSVSKTHLEFGHTGGVLWVLDRHSGNGTSITTIDGDERRCDAGKRYRAARGTKVTIGEQFFEVY